MDDLIERIYAAIENRNGHPWLPELTADLAARAWDNLFRSIGLTPNTYATERVLSHTVSAPRQIIGDLSMSPYITGALAMSIETLSQEGAAEYQERGVSFYSSDEIPHTSVLSCIGEALTIINLVPSVRRTVVTLVRSLHVIKPANEDYDVSFSEPQIPFSVFVSVPRRRIPNDAIRTAEAIVHEAMHLQLTLIERVVPLIVAISAEYNSPWKIEKRDVEGILQSVFVFATIDRFLDELLSIKNGRTSRPYIHHRQREIRDQIWRVRSFRDSNELTEAGCRLVTWLTDVDEYNRTSAITAYEA